MLNKIKIAWYGKHFGEEPPLVGDKNQGSGTIFFSGCNLHCIFCQNFQISQQGVGEFFLVEEVVDMMLELQKQGAVNINLVTPTIWFEQIKSAIIAAKKQGLILPIVWNSNGYERVEMIKSLKGLIDIYLPDLKYGDDEVAFKYSKIKNYSIVALAAIKEMYNQVGNLIVDEKGLAKKGLIVRHLVLPSNFENSFKALKMIADIDKKINVSLMNQYSPLFNVKNYPEINRKVTDEEIQKVIDYFLSLGLENGWTQTEKSSDILIPDFNKKKPFKKIS